MATVRLAPVVSDISGKIAGTVFSNWKGRNYIRRLVTPNNPQSVGQTAQRDALARCVVLYRFLSAAIKARLDVASVPLRLSGYNWFMQQNIVDELLYNTGKLLPHNAQSLIIQTFAVATGASGIITLTWTDPSHAECDFVNYAYRKVAVGSEADRFTMGTQTAVATQTKSISGLTAGALYRVVAWFENTGATIIGESDSGEATSGA